MLYEVTIRQAYNNTVECINRLHYNSNNVLPGNEGSIALAEGLGFIPSSGGTSYPSGRLFESLRFLQSVAVRFIELQVAAMYDPLDFYTIAPTIVVGGEVAGPCLPPSNAFGFTAARTVQNIRRGQKRFPGVAESAQTDGIIEQSFYEGAVGTVAQELSSTLTPNQTLNDVVFTPRTLKYQAYTTDRGNRAYRKYPTLAEQLVNSTDAAGWQGKRTVRSQVSRQF